MEQTQYNYFPEPDRERKLHVCNVIIPCLYCNIVAEKKTNKNHMRL